VISARRFDIAITQFLKLPRVAAEAHSLISVASIISPRISPARQLVGIRRRVLLD
jgi:hypothetical protein